MEGCGCKDERARAPCNTRYQNVAVQVPQALRRVDVVRQIALQHKSRGAAVVALDAEAGFFDVDS